MSGVQILFPARIFYISGKRQKFNVIDDLSCLFFYQKLKGQFCTSLDCAYTCNGSKKLPRDLEMSRPLIDTLPELAKRLKVKMHRHAM